MCTSWLQSEFKISVVGFNAWSQSHTQMPLVDLVSALTAESKPTVGPLKKIVATVGWHVAKFGTRGLVDRDVIAEATVSEDSWDNAEKETTEFKRQLQGWAEASGPRGLVVCVDELDQCRPEYALSLLEVTRHLFDVSGVVVLLAINRGELAHSVKSIPAHRRRRRLQQAIRIHAAAASGSAAHRRLTAPSGSATTAPKRPSALQRRHDTRPAAKIAESAA